MFFGQDESIVDEEMKGLEAKKVRKVDKLSLPRASTSISGNVRQNNLLGIGPNQTVRRAKRSQAFVETVNKHTG